MIRLRDKETGADLGTISEEQMDFLQEQLEEESASDTNYYIGRDELGILAEAGADTEVMALLRSAIGDRDGVEIEWAEE